MVEEQLFEVVDPVLTGLRSRLEPGEEFRSPPLDVLRYYSRPVRLHWLPMIGRGQSVVAFVRQPVDVGLSASGSSKGYKAFLERLAGAVNGRFPPGNRRGWGSLALTAVVLTPEPIGAGDDDLLKEALQASMSMGATARSRVVPLGLIRLNLGQEAMAFQLAEGPDGLFPEPVAVVDALTAKFRRYVPLFDGT